MTLDHSTMERLGFLKGSVMPDGDTEYFLEDGTLHGWLMNGVFSVDYNGDYGTRYAEAKTVDEVIALTHALTGRKLSQ